MGKLDGKVAIVTGGSGGIGSAAARLFAAEGGRVMLVDLDAQALQGVVAPEKVRFVAAPVAVAAAAEREDVLVISVSSSSMYAAAVVGGKLRTVRAHEGFGLLQLADDGSVDGDLERILVDPGHVSAQAKRHGLQLARFLLRKRLPSGVADIIVSHLQPGDVAYLPPVPEGLLLLARQVSRAHPQLKQVVFEGAGSRVKGVRERVLSDLGLEEVPVSYHQVCMHGLHKISQLH